MEDQQHAKLNSAKYNFLTKWSQFMVTAKKHESRETQNPDSVSFLTSYL
jgi:hypothetical protein